MSNHGILMFSRFVLRFGYKLLICRWNYDAQWVWSLKWKSLTENNFIRRQLKFNCSLFWLIRMVLLRSEVWVAHQNRLIKRTIKLQSEYHIRSFYISFFVRLLFSFSGWNRKCFRFKFGKIICDLNAAGRHLNIAFDMFLAGGAYVCVSCWCLWPDFHS